jgi:heme-degrading monooxygenase HmoA
MVLLAREQNGYLGHESVREGLGITISYWKTLEDIKNWKQVSDHLTAQRLGREQWYQAYKTRICLVERDYGFEI